jgi:hypothetical protein
MSAIPTRGVFQVDGWGWVKTPVTYVSMTYEINHGENHNHAEWRIFGIYYNDSRGIVKTDNRPESVRAGDLSAINIGTYGGHFIDALPTTAGKFDFLAWELGKVVAGATRLSEPVLARWKPVFSPTFGKRCAPGSAAAFGRRQSQ